MPVPAQVGIVEGHHHDVADPEPDLVVAAGAEVGLGGLVRMDAPYLYRGISAHRISASATAKAASTYT